MPALPRSSSRSTCRPTPSASAPCATAPAARPGFGRPLRLSLKSKLEACRHPAWLADYLRHGVPVFSNWQRYAPAGAGTEAVAEFVSSQIPVPVTWQDIEAFRRAWPGTLVLKGI